jgi:hypothetical protein
MNNVHQITDFLLPDELESIKDNLDKKIIEQEDNALGRVIYRVPISGIILGDIRDRVSAIVGKKLGSPSVIFTDYSSQYGQPNLPPHFDGDDNSVIVDYQYSSNTSWGLGIDSRVFELEDNKAIIFNPNEYPHWRPHKTFEDGEYITMIFIRFPDGSDYSNLVLSQDDAAFDTARRAREAL